MPARPNPHEPTYPIEAPEKPSYVADDAIASAEWDRIVPMLLDQRVITAAYRAALEAYCSSYADVVRAERLKAQPDFVPFVASTMKSHPLVKQAHDARRELRAWAGVLGLLPTTVGKVSAAPMPEADDPDDALLTRMEARRTGTVVPFQMGAEIQTNSNRR